MQQIKNEDTTKKAYSAPKIGKIIEKELRRQERTVTWLSRQLNCARRNVYDIFSRSYIDTELLFRISIVLDTDFFKYYSEALNALPQHQGGVATYYVSAN